MEQEQTLEDILKGTEEQILKQFEGTHEEKVKQYEEAYGETVEDQLARVAQIVSRQPRLLKTCIACKRQEIE